MKKLLITLGLLLLSIFVIVLSTAQDWANLEQFKNENDALKDPAPGENRVVFMGNSITIGWIEICPEFFEGKSYINRGISGQTTPQMLVRFRPDVIDLKPAVVVILAGINDIAENTGPMTLEMTMGNIISMCELAEANNIQVVLSSVLPVYSFYDLPHLNPADKVTAINKMIKEYAKNSGIVYLDYYTSMVDQRKGLREELTRDGIHPVKAGYQIMEPLVEEAIQCALGHRMRRAKRN
ncbi:MAG: SGNH/GDSL hydrolase family protein [Bacteroidota bacterium]